MIHGTTRVRTTPSRRRPHRMDEDFYGYDLEHVGIDDEDDGGLALTEELGADSGPL